MRSAGHMCAAARIEVRTRNLNHSELTMQLSNRSLLITIVGITVLGNLA